MFESRKKLTDRIETLQSALGSMTRERDDARAVKSAVEREYEQKIRLMKDEHDAALRLAKQIATEEKDAELITARQELAVVKKENEMLKAINELDSDVLDIKELVTKIIDKLPQINLTSLSVQGQTQPK